MYRIAIIVLALCCGGSLHGGSVEPFGGETVTGKVEVDFGGILFRPAQGAAVKLDLNNLYRVKFDDAPGGDCVPGVMLSDGSRLAAPYGPLSEPKVTFSKRNILIPSAEIAWIIYERFPAPFAANAPAGETGALLPGGDFFSGTVRGADADAVKVFNAIFGPRRLDARRHEVLAAVLKPARPLAAQYEILAADGSLFGVENFSSGSSGFILRSSLFDGLKLAINEVIEIRAGANRCRTLASAPQLHAEPPAGLQPLPEGGLSSDAKTVVSCAVPAGFTDFVTRVAAAPDTTAGQRMFFTLYVNGTPLARSTAMAAGDPPQALRISLAGARTLVLRVETPPPPAGAPPAAVASGRWLQPLFLRR